MILSIIIIAAILGTAVYAIRYFLQLKQCTELGLYARDLQVKIDDAWNSDSVHDTFTGVIPGSVDEICMGDVTQAKNKPEYNILKRYEGRDANLFYYISPSSCSVKYANLKHVRFSTFFCIKTSKGKATVSLEKNSEDSLVLLKPL